MLLYNSLSREKELFTIPSDRPVTLYVCGVTPYDTTHIGHARTYIIFDVLLRFLRWQGADIRYCQNVTDVDDPLFARARRDGVDWQELAESQVARFVEDCSQLNILPPTYFPRASDEIDAMIPIITRLIELGHAYEVEGNVYFSVASDPGFGSLAFLEYDEMLNLANQRGNNPDDPRKRDPLDFVLWQTGSPDDPNWESPWGPGRPGWHIECSAMATRYLGDHVDIHGGGRDLIFPHHPCEIAQTEPVTGKRPFVNIWMHAGLVWLDGEKMSKSLGNLVFARDALAEHGPDVLRWYLLSTHYRADFFYDRAEVEHIANHIQRVRDALTQTGGTGTPIDISQLRDELVDAMRDDLDTPLALGLLETMTGAIHDGASAGRNIDAARTILADMVGLLGFPMTRLS